MRRRRGGRGRDPHQTAPCGGSALRVPLLAPLRPQRCFRARARPLIATINGTLTRRSAPDRTALGKRRSSWGPPGRGGLRRPFVPAATHCNASAVPPPTHTHTRWGVPEVGAVPDVGDISGVNGAEWPRGSAGVRPRAGGRGVPGGSARGRKVRALLRRVSGARSGAGGVTREGKDRSAAQGSLWGGDGFGAWRRSHRTGGGGTHSAGGARRVCLGRVRRGGEGGERAARRTAHGPTPPPPPGPAPPPAVSTAPPPRPGGGEEPTGGAPRPPLSLQPIGCNGLLLPSPSLRHWWEPPSVSAVAPPPSRWLRRWKLWGQRSVGPAPLRSAPLRSAPPRPQPRPAPRHRGPARPFPAARPRAAPRFFNPLFFVVVIILISVFLALIIFYFSICPPLLLPSSPPSPPLPSRLVLAVAISVFFSCSNSAPPSALRSPAEPGSPRRPRPAMGAVVAVRRCGRSAGR